MRLNVLGGVKGSGAPATPTLTYSADSQFTISNYDASLIYTVTGCTRTGSSLTGVSSGATIKAKRALGTPESPVRTMLLLTHTYYATDIIYTPGIQEGCGPQCVSCSSGYADVVTGSTSFGCGTFHPELCGGSCPGDCFLIVPGPCYNRALTDYSGSGYTLQGSKWGKST